MDLKKTIYRCIATIMCVGMCHGKCCGRGYTHKLLVMKDGRVTNGGTYNRDCPAKTRFNTCRKHGADRPFICQVYKCNKLNRLSQIFSQALWTGYLEVKEK